MPDTFLDTLSWAGRNRNLDVYLEELTYRVYVSPLYATDDAEPILSEGGALPTRTFAPGSLMLQFPEGNELVKVTSAGASPYGVVTREAAPAPTGPGDIAITLAYQSAGTGIVTATATITTSRPPFFAWLDNEAPQQGRTVWSVEEGTSHNLTVRDAGPFQRTISFTAPFLNQPVPPPAGQIIDTFEFEGRPIDLYDSPAAGTDPRRIVPYSPGGYPLPTGTLSAGTRGRQNQELIGTACEAPHTLIAYRALLVSPWATVMAEANSIECDYVPGTVTPDFSLSRSTPVAPVAPATTGRWQVDTAGGTAPRRVSIPGVTPAGGTLLDSTGYAELTGLAPGPYTATLTDSSSPVQTLLVNFTVPAGGPPPAPAYPPALPGAPPQNLETFPFTDETPVDQLGTGCPDPAYYLAAPRNSFLPFCLRLPRTPDRWLQCARVLDAGTGEVLEEFDPRLLSFQKFEDETSAYFLYYGSAVQGLTLPLCRPLRLQVDEMTSVAFVAHSDLSGHLWCRWWHPGPLHHLPYGTGLQQHLYVVGAVLREQEARQERTETKNAATGAVRVDFLAQARTVSFETEPLPSWLVQAVQGSRLHAWFAAGSSFYQGEYPVREVKQRELSAEFCGRLLSLTLEYPPLAVNGCGPTAPALVPLPSAYPPTC